MASKRLWVPPVPGCRTASKTHYILRLFVEVKEVSTDWTNLVSDRGQFEDWRDTERLEVSKSRSKKVRRLIEATQDGECLALS